MVTRRITDRNAVVERDEECVRISAKVISECGWRAGESKAIISQFAENSRPS